MKEDIIYKYKKLFKDQNFLKEYIQTDIGTKLDDTSGDLYDNNGKWDLDQFISNSALCHLEKLLQEQNKSLTSFGLPSLNMHKE